MAEPVCGRLYQPVGEHVIGELVVPDLDRQWYAEPAAQLLVKPDAPPHGVQRLLLRPVAMQHAAGESPAGVGGQGYRQRIGKRVLITVAKIFGLEFDLADGVAGQGQHLRDANFRLYDDGQVADLDGADG